MGLKRTLNLFDAASIGIGAIIGAGIFVVSGIAIGYAGPAIVISMIIAGLVASFTAYSFAELGAAIPKEGGVYAFTYEVISPSGGFVIGCVWLFGQIVAGAAISLGLASYCVALIPFFSLKFVAVSAAATLTLLNILGMKQSTFVNNILVVTKIAILIFFITVGLGRISLQNYSPFLPNGFAGVLQGAAFIFFAYLGFGRIATVAEEVKTPQRTLPLSILLALATSMILYALTGFTAVGLLNYRTLANSGSPIADAAGMTGSQSAVFLISIGALIATASVLLTSLLGLSRVSFAMARNGQIPKFMTKLHPKFGTPYVSILIMGAVMVPLVLFADLRQTAAISSFSLLFTHVFLNYSAIKLRKKIPDAKTFKAPFYPLTASLGLVSCLILMFSLPIESWIVGAIVAFLSVICYLIANNKGKFRLSKS